MSLFDDILSPSAAHAKSSLFSSSSKYKAAKPAWQATQPVANSDKPANSVAPTGKGKDEVKKSKKRKHAETVEHALAPVPAPQELEPKKPAVADAKSQKKRKAAVTDQEAPAVISDKPPK